MTVAAASPREGCSEALAALSVSAVAVAFYALTMPRGLTGGDAGELIAAAASGGVAHPPGYPLFLILGRLFALLPVGSLALRFNLLSAVCGAGAAAFLFLAAARWSGSRWAALVAASLFAFSPTVWHWATGAEVFALNNLLLALLLWCAVRFAESRERRWALWGAFAAGLGLSNHHESVLSAIPLALWLALDAPELFRGRNRLWVALAFAAGLAPYLYLPVAGSHSATVTWGATRTWSGFWTHVLRREYGTFRLSVDAGRPGFGAVLGSWTRTLRSDFGWLGLGAVALGLGATLRRRLKARGLVLAVLGAALLPALVFAVLGNLPLKDALQEATYGRFWQQSLLFASALVAQGIAMAVQHVSFQAVLCGALALLPPALGFRSLDRSEGRTVEAYGADILRVAPPGALLIARGDLIVNAIRYLQVAERTRPDVRVVADGFLAFPWGRQRVAQMHPDVVIPGEVMAPTGVDPVRLIEANLDRFPVLLCGGIEDTNRAVAARYVLWPLGLCQLVQAPGAPVDAPAIEHWIAESEAALPTLPTGPHPPGSWEDVVYRDDWTARQLRSLKLMELAGHDPLRRGYLELAAKILEGIVAGEPDPPPQNLPEPGHGRRPPWNRYAGGARSCREGLAELPRCRAGDRPAAGGDPGRAQAAGELGCAGNGEIEDGSVTKRP